MSKFRLQEASDLPHNKGKKKINLYRLLWPYANSKTQTQSGINLFNGKTKNVNIEFIPIICKFYLVDANFLYGIRRPRR